MFPYSPKWQLMDWQHRNKLGHSVQRMYLRQRCFNGSMNKTILKPCIAAAAGRANTYSWDFPNVKFRVPALYDIGETIQFQHPDYNPDWAQKLISSSTQHFIQIHACVFE